MTEDDDLRARLRSETDHLSPDVAGLVSGGTTRGRARRRRHLVGTSAATVLAVGAVAAGAALLSSGSGLLAHDGGPAAAGSSSIIQSIPATHGTTHRDLTSSTGVSDRLLGLLPGGADPDATVGVGAGGYGGADQAQDLSAFAQWHGGTVQIDLSDGDTAHAVTTQKVGSPPSPSATAAPHSAYRDPERSCRAEAAQAAKVTQPCHQVENGDWAFAAADAPDVAFTLEAPTPGTADEGSAQRGGAGDEPSTGACPAPCPGYSSDLTVTASDAPGQEEGTAVPVEGDFHVLPSSSVNLYTSDGWRIVASATAPDATADPVLGEDDLQLMAQDGGWFLAPGETPSPDPTTGVDATTGPGTCDPCQAPPTSVPGTAVPVTGRTPRAVEDLPQAFAKLIPGTITHIHAVDGSTDHPVTTFDWDGHPVRVSIRHVTPPAGGAASAGSTGSGSSTAETLSTSTVTPDGWQVDLRIDGVGGTQEQDALLDLRLTTAGLSDTWFTTAD